MYLHIPEIFSLLDQKNNFLYHFDTWKKNFKMSVEELTHLHA